MELLKGFSSLFDGTLGGWTTVPVDLELKDPQSKIVCPKLYTVPKSKEHKLKQEYKRLCDLNIFKKMNKSQYGITTFTISKSAANLRSLIDSGKLNKLIKNDISIVKDIRHATKLYQRSVLWFSFGVNTNT